MPRLNIASPEFHYDDADPEGFRAGMFRFGPKLGAKETGASVYELPPGQSICPYHYEYGEEEWLLVLEGNAQILSFDVSIGDALFLDADHARVATGSCGLGALLVYGGPEQIPGLLRKVGTNHADLPDLSAEVKH